MITLDMVYDASQVLKSVARKTPVLASPKTNLKAKNVYIKCENMQVTGSFKLRGGYYKIAKLTDEEAEKGVIACSAGNHAQGVALAAQKRGIKATICIPEGAPVSKVEATRSYGAEVVLCPGVYDDAYATAMKLQEEHGYTFIHPFNDDYVMAGQGTIGLEVLDQIPDLDAVFVPVGGGGIISGIAYAIKQLKPECKVYGVQAAGAPSMYNSIRDGKIERLDSVVTMADGIAVKEPGDKTFEVCQKYVDEIVTVTEPEIATAILSLIEDHKLVAEGAGAVSVAAAMFDKVDITGKNVACIVSGGNVDVNILSRIIDKALLNTGRVTYFSVELPDKPGQLNRILRLVAKSGGNVTSIIHDRTEMDLNVGKCLVNLTVETRNHNHVKEILNLIRKDGYVIKQK